MSKTNLTEPVSRTALITIGISFIAFMFVYNPSAIIGILVIVGSGILIGVGLYAK